MYLIHEAETDGMKVRSRSTIVTDFNIFLRNGQKNWIEGIF